MKNISDFIKALLDQILVSGGNFVTVLLGARYLTLEGQGKFGYILAAYLAISILNQTLIFQLASVEAPKTDEYYYVFVQILQLLVSFVGTILFTMLLVWLGASSGWKMSVKEILIVLLFLFLQQQADFVRRSAYIFTSITVSIIYSAILYPTRLLILMALKPNNIFSFSLILGLTALIPAMKSIIDLFKSKKDTKRICKFIKPHFKMSQWLVLSAPFSWLWCNIPIFALGMHGNLMQVGVFTTLRSITNAGNVLLETLETYISALAGKCYIQNKTVYNRLIKTTLFSGLVLWSIGFFVFLILGKDLIKILFTNDYKDFSLLLVFLWTGILSVFLSRLSSVTTRTVGKTNTIFYSLIIGTLVSYGISLFIIPQYNVYGAAIAIGVAPLIMWAFQEIDVRLFIKKQIESSSKETESCG